MINYFSCDSCLIPGTDVMITIFCNFWQFLAKKMAFFSETKVMIIFLNNLALFWAKNANFFADFSAKISKKSYHRPLHYKNVLCRHKVSSNLLQLPAKSFSKSKGIQPPAQLEWNYYNCRLPLPCYYYVNPILWYMDPINNSFMQKFLPFTSKNK
jgi:hypothetical protein